MLTAFVAVAVFARQGVLPAPDAVEQVVGTEWLLYLHDRSSPRCCSASCEVLYDNSAQTFLPAIVDDRATWSGPTGGCTRPSWSPTSSSARRSPACCWRSGSPCRSSSTPARSPRRRSLVFSIAVTAPTGARPMPPTRRAVAGGDRRGLPLAVAPRRAADAGHLARRAQPAGATSASPLFVLFGQEVLGTSTTEFAILMRRRGDRRRGRRLDGLGGHRNGSGPGRRWPCRVGAGRWRRSPSASCRPGPSSPWLLVADDVLRRALERDHGQLPPDGHPRSPARPGQQRLPLLRVGAIPIGALIGGVHRRRPRRTAVAGRGAPGAVGRRRRWATLALCPMVRTHDSASGWSRCRPAGREPEHPVRSTPHPRLALSTAHVRVVTRVLGTRVLRVFPCVRTQLKVK